MVREAMGFSWRDYINVGSRGGPFFAEETVLKTFRIIKIYSYVTDISFFLSVNYFYMRVFGYLVTFIRESFYLL